jgi:hypothetical protein
VPFCECSLDLRTGPYLEHLVVRKIFAVRIDRETKPGMALLCIRPQFLGLPCAAFLIPMLERLKEHSSRAGSRAVILAPTRELALQTFKVRNTADESEA